MATCQLIMDEQLPTHLNAPCPPVVTAFEPNGNNTRQYRDALGQFGTGVTIITTMGTNGPVGMTVNSFASVSLEPALVLWSLAKNSGRFEPFFNAKHFAIQVLKAEQSDLALKFAKNGDAFSHCDWEYSKNNTPVINDTLTRFECRREAHHDTGDHIIIVGCVEIVVASQGKPLIFSAGKFGTFSNQ